MSDTTTPLITTILVFLVYGELCRKALSGFLFVQARKTQNTSKIIGLTTTLLVHLSRHFFTFTIHYYADGQTDTPETLEGNYYKESPKSLRDVTTVSGT